MVQTLRTQQQVLDLFTPVSNDCLIVKWYATSAESTTELTKQNDELLFSLLAYNQKLLPLGSLFVNAE